MNQRTTGLAGAARHQRRPFRPDTSTYSTVLHPEDQTTDWKAFYDTVDRRTDETRAAVRNVLDVAYGEHPKQFLDIYLPHDEPMRAPVFVFVHGGGFREGDRAHYGFVAAPFAASGIVTVVPSYRLMPEFTYFDAVEDVRSALAWVVRDHGDYGGDPGAIVVGGHSAGGVLAAFVGADTAWLKARSPECAIRAIAPISAGYDFTSDDVPSYARHQLGDDAARRAASPLHNVRESAPRAVVAVGAREELYLGPSRSFAERLRASAVETDLMIVPDLDHAGTVLALGDGASELHRAVVGLLRA